MLGAVYVPLGGGFTERGVQTVEKEIEKKPVVVTRDEGTRTGHVPMTVKALGNVPTSEEFNRQVEAFNLLIEQLRDKGIID